MPTDHSVLASDSAQRRMAKSGRDSVRYSLGAASLVGVVLGLLAVSEPVGAQTGIGIEANPIMAVQTIAVDHVRIETNKPFAEVRTALEQTMPKIEPGLVEALARGDAVRAESEKIHGPELSIFQVRDHGALLNIAGMARNALQYDIGNPVTASLMTRRQLAAAMYAPIRVVLYENAAGHGVFEYDQPSTTFGQFGDEQVTLVAQRLDASLAHALLSAAK